MGSVERARRWLKIQGTPEARRRRAVKHAALRRVALSPPAAGDAIRLAGGDDEDAPGVADII